MKGSRTREQPVVAPVFLGDVRHDGRLVLDRPATLVDYLETLIGIRVELRVRPWRAQRSYEQLKYWFGVPMALLSEYTGYTKMQMHYLCLAECFGVVHDATTGHEVPVVPASRHLSTKQFSELIEWCPPWAFETYEMEIPLPESPAARALLDEAPGVIEA